MKPSIFGPICDTFFLISFSCLFCSFFGHSSLLLDKENINPEGSSFHFSAPPQEKGKNIKKRKRPPPKDDCPIAKKKRTPFTPRTKKRIARLQETYGFSEKKTLEAHWVHKSISRGARGITISSISDIFSTSEIGKLYDSRRNKRQYISTADLKRVQKRLFQNNLPKTQEVPERHQLSGIRTRSHLKEEWDRYLSGINNLKKYEKRLFLSYQESIVSEKKDYTLGTGPYPTLRGVQEKFLTNVAPHMTHFQVFYNGSSYYDVYLCQKSLEFSEENLERLHSGLAPLGHDGQSMHIHHLTQRGPTEASGSKNERIILVFMSEELHSKEHGKFHFDRALLFEKKRFFGINRSLCSSHRLMILEAAYGELSLHPKT